MRQDLGTQYEGHLDAKGLRIAVVVSRFNDFITGRLLAGAMDGLRRHGVHPGDVDVAWTPGAFELPLVARRLAATGSFQAVICLAAVIRGGTPHFEYVCSQAARGIQQAGLDTGVPTIFGVITADTIEQAIERTGTKAGNKAWEAAVSAVEMARLMESLP